MAEDFHMHDAGSILRITVKENGVPLDISGCSAKKISFRKKDGTILTVNASFLTDGTDGKLTYTFQEGDLDQSGDWKYQVLVYWDETSHWYTNTGTFNVAANLAEVEPPAI